MSSLQRYIADESRNKLGQELDTSEWPIRCAIQSAGPFFSTGRKPNEAPACHSL